MRRRIDSPTQGRYKEEQHGDEQNDPAAATCSEMTGDVRGFDHMENHQETPNLGSIKELRFSITERTDRFFQYPVNDP
jgi:hypothetical protein